MRTPSDTQSSAAGVTQSPSPADHDPTYQSHRQRERCSSRLWVQGLAALGGVAIGCSAGAFVLMQVLPPGKWLDPISTPLSNYAVTDVGQWFDAALWLLAVGVLAVLTALVLARLVPIGSFAFGWLALCGLGLVGMVLFPDYANATGQLTTSGWLHVGASALAFGGPPLACLALSRRHRRVTGCSRLPAISGWLGTFTLGWCAVLITVTTLGFAAGSTTGSSTVPRIEWSGTAGSGLAAWQSHPYDLGSSPAYSLTPGFGGDYGLIERGLTVAELLIALVLVVFAWRGCRCARL